MTQESQSAEAVSSTIDDILYDLAAPAQGMFPYEAVHQARQRKAELIPELIEMLATETRKMREVLPLTPFGAIMPMFLLAEFNAKEALPTIMEAISLPGDLSYDMLGDVLTEDLPRILCSLCDSPRELAEDLIRTKDRDVAVRWAGATMYRYLVRDGLVSREEAVQRLKEHLVAATRDSDDEVMNGLVCELMEYGPAEAMDEITAAFEASLVDESLVTLNHVERSVAGGEAAFRKGLERLPPTAITDAVAELEGFDYFSGAPDLSRLASMMLPKGTTPYFDPTEDLYDSVEAVDPIRNTGAKVGRNDPCPCGSGKKYKKCCKAE